MNTETASAIRALAEQVKDLSKPEEERRSALRHICELRGDPSYAVAEIPTEELRSVASAMRPIPSIGFSGLSVKDAIEAVREGRRRREAFAVHPA